MRIFEKQSFCTNFLVYTEKCKVGGTTMQSVTFKTYFLTKSRMKVEIEK